MGVAFERRVREEVGISQGQMKKWGMGKTALAIVLGLWTEVVRHRGEPQATDDHS